MLLYIQLTNGSQVWILYFSYLKTNLPGYTSIIMLPLWIFWMECPQFFSSSPRLLPFPPRFFSLFFKLVTYNVNSITVRVSQIILYAETKKTYKIISTVVVWVSMKWGFFWLVIIWTCNWSIFMSCVYGCMDLINL